ncbi:hypothetical protein [Nonomuraea maheshkhaliensis]|uniref:hypothetical protein n=1 Tax=Nonomuraea maheshkhaliensis TaxID=419590 RepID=UPI0031F7AC25
MRAHRAGVRPCLFGGTGGPSAQPVLTWRTANIGGVPLATPPIARPRQETPASHRPVDRSTIRRRQGNFARVSLPSKTWSSSPKPSAGPFPPRGPATSPTTLTWGEAAGRRMSTAR